MALLSFSIFQELSGDEGSFDKALFKFYLNQVRYLLYFSCACFLCCWLFSLVEVTFVFMFFQKVKSLKRKLSSAGRRNVVSPPSFAMLSFGFSLFILLFLF